eukprot:sb/3464186/
MQIQTTCSQDIGVYVAILDYGAQKTQVVFVLSVRDPAGAGSMPVEGTLFRPVLLRVEGITGSNTPRWFFSPSSAPGQEVALLPDGEDQGRLVLKANSAHLLIHSFTNEDEGYYRAEMNSDGQLWSRWFYAVSSRRSADKSTGVYSIAGGDAIMSPSFESSSYKWLRDNTTSIAPEHSRLNIYGKVMQIKNLMVQDEASYTVYDAYNPKVRMTLLQSTMQQKILSGGQILQFRTTTEDNFTVYLADVVCSNGHRERYQFALARNSRPPRVLSAGGRSLELLNLAYESSGLYQAQIDYGFGEVDSSFVYDVRVTRDDRYDEKVSFRPGSTLTFRGMWNSNFHSIRWFRRIGGNWEGMTNIQGTIDIRGNTVYITSPSRDYAGYYKAQFLSSTGSILHEVVWLVVVDTSSPTRRFEFYLVGVEGYGAAVRLPEQFRSVGVEGVWRRDDGRTAEGWRAENGYLVIPGSLNVAVTYVATVGQDTYHIHLTVSL